jgi:hypothetical protein
MALIIISITLAIVTLLAAYGAGLFESRIGSVAVAVVALLIVVGGLPSAAFLVTTVSGWLMTGYLCLLIGEFYHRLFRTAAIVDRHQPVSVVGWRKMVGFRFNNVVVVAAWQGA